MDALEYARELVAFESTSHLSNVPVSDYVEAALKRLGFTTERINFRDAAGVDKSSVIGKLGDGSGGLGYFGHTDVVPAADWFSDEHGPFTPQIVGDRLYGRGSCDMKGSIACMLAAAEQITRQKLRWPLYVACTADEEVGFGGARELVQRSELFHEMVAGQTRGIIGEPTLLEVVHAHKGSYVLRTTSHGKASHSSTGLGVNANLAMIPFLFEMKRLYDEIENDPAWRNEEFNPPTLTMNIGINDHTDAINITAPQSICRVLFRPMPGQDAESLLNRARQAAERCGVDFEVLSRGRSVYTDPNSEFVQSVLKLAGRETSRTVSYGTDGSMLTDLQNLVVFGPGSIEQAHTNDEWIALSQLELGTAMYRKLIDTWCL